MEKFRDADEIGSSTLQRFKGYDRIMGNISWLLIALVTLDIKLMPSDHSSLIFLASLCVLLFAYNFNARYGLLSNRYSQFKTFVDLMVFLAFIVGVCWYTGRVTSPFISLIYLILMATSLTQGHRVTYFMAGLAMTSYILLASNEFREGNNIFTHILELFPFMLIAHLGAMLSGETETARHEVERLSLTDEVTGINNMRSFFIQARVHENLSKRHNRSYAICMLDADNLKKINDQYGHFAGTELIRHVAAMITANTRNSDVCARYGGDEFVIMLNESSKDEAAVAIERIVTGMSTSPFTCDDTTLTATLSAGVAAFPEDGGDLRTVMAKADEAMYISKRNGKNRLTIYSKADNNND